MIDWFLSNISAKYYKNLSMLSRVIAENVGDVFFETVYVVCYSGLSKLVFGMACRALKLNGTK